jgi:hypothetical protein
MSLKQLRKAARLKIPQQMPDFESKLLMMLMADRTDRRGRFIAPDNDQLVTELMQEANAVRARLTGDEFIRLGVDNDRISRVVEAYREAEDE